MLVHPKALLTIHIIYICIYVYICMCRVIKWLWDNGRLVTNTTKSQWTRFRKKIKNLECPIAMKFLKFSNNTIRSLQYNTFSIYAWLIGLPIKIATSAFDPLAFFLHEPCNILCHVQVNHRWRLHINSRVPRDSGGHFEYCHLVGENVYFTILIAKNMRETCRISQSPLCLLMA